MTHFLQPQESALSDDRDYLGLEVWLRYDADWNFSVYRNTDSSGI